MIAVFFASQKDFASFFNDRANNNPPHQHKVIVKISQAMIPQYEAVSSPGEFIARHIPRFPGKVESIINTCRTNW